MKTYILPGGSEKNKEWVDLTVSELSPTFTSKGVYWKHWNGDQTEGNWIEKEAQRIINDFNNEKVNIIAKSVGTMVCMAILKLQSSLVNKIILCGIALNDFSEDDQKEFLVLKNLPPENILCIQNVDDTHGSFAKVETFIHDINSNIKIISKPRDDHNYPYSIDFIEYLNK
jgi:predicted alpha/beta hydrolase family esterase